jgi:hypothetical protein
MVDENILRALNEEFRPLIPGILERVFRRLMDAYLESLGLSPAATGVPESSEEATTLALQPRFDVEKLTRQNEFLQQAQQQDYPLDLEQIFMGADLQDAPQDAPQDEAFKGWL